MLKSEKKEILLRRKEHRLREIQSIVDDYSKLYAIKEDIMLKVVNGPDVESLKDRLGFSNCINLYKGTLNINKGLLELDLLPQSVIKKLIALELAHFYYKDDLISNLHKDLLFLRKLKYSHTRGLISVLAELRSEILATQIMGLVSAEEIEMSNTYSGYDFLKCYQEQGYPDRELRTNICIKYNKFTRKTIEEVFYLYKRKLIQNGYKFNITIEDVDTFVETLPSEWKVNWPPKHNANSGIESLQS